MSVMDKIVIIGLSSELRKMATTPNIIDTPIDSRMVYHINSNISYIIDNLKNNYPIISKHLEILSKNLFIDKNNFFMVNPFACGQILGLIDFLCEIYDRKTENFWSCIHPRIVKSSQKLYLDGHYSKAALSAFLEINDRMKEIYHKLKPDVIDIPDGYNLMNTLLSEKKPIFIIDDLDTDEGKDIQSGFRLMLAGAMSALRNPPAHSNKKILTAEESMRRLMFASMLMYKIDEAWENIQN